MTIVSILCEMRWLTTGAKSAFWRQELASLIVRTRHMTSSLIRRLVLAALALIAMTLLALYYTLTTYSQGLVGAPGDPAVRLRVIEVALGGALLALLVAVVVSRSLTTPVRRLKRPAAGLLGAAAEPSATCGAIDDLGSLQRALGGVGHE